MYFNEGVYFYRCPDLWSVRKLKVYLWCHFEGNKCLPRVGDKEGASSCDNTIPLTYINIKDSLSCQDNMLSWQLEVGSCLIGPNNVESKQAFYDIIIIYMFSLIYLFIIFYPITRFYFVFLCLWLLFLVYEFHISILPFCYLSYYVFI